MQKNCLSLVNNKSVLLLHDKASPLIAQVPKEKIMALNIKILVHPPYTPDFSPSVILSDYCIIF